MVKYKSIVLSGKPVSGKSTLAGMIEAEFGWQRQSVGGLWREKYAKLSAEGKVTESFEEYWSKTSYGENLEMNKRAWDITNAGGVIMESRYPLGYDRQNVLIVFVDASLDVRVSRARKGQSISP